MADLAGVGQEASRVTDGEDVVPLNDEVTGGTDDREVVPRDSATVLLVRDGVEGLEVLLLERHLDSDFAGGALVFPGGKVDDADRHLDPARLTGTEPARWRQPLGAANDADAQGLLVAAVRETFEEVGVLLVIHADGRAVTAAELASPSFVGARRQLASRHHGEGADFATWLETEDLVLDLGALAFWSWWTTPTGGRKRFDTRFFVVVAPPDQTPAEDGNEATRLTWSTPAAAVEAQRRGEAVVIFPTRRNLADLGRFTTAADAWRAAAAGEVEHRRIQPTVVRDGDRVLVEHPLDGTREPI